MQMARAIGQEVQENSQVADSLVSTCIENFDYGPYAASKEKMIRTTHSTTPLSKQLKESAQI